MAKIVTLKNASDEYVYPVTHVDAINGALGTSKLADSSVTTAKIADGAITNDKLGSASVKSDNIDWTTLGLANYSTAETPTGGAWVDGKVIYRKVVNFGNLPNTATKNVAHGITNISTVINIYGVANYANGVRLPLPFYTPAATGNGVSLSLTSTDIQIQTGVDRSAATAYVIIEYTKS